MQALLILAMALAQAPEAAPPAPEMLRVEAGAFTMGAAEEEERTPDELARHEVQLPAFLIARHETTNGLAAAILNWAFHHGQATPPPQTERQLEHEGKPLLLWNEQTGALVWDGQTVTVRDRDGQHMSQHPLVNVSWYGAAALCNWLSLSHGLNPAYDLTTWSLADRDAGGYRLPSEAEWERTAGWDATTANHWVYALPDATLSINAANYFDYGGQGYANPLRISEPYTSPVGHFSGGSPVGCKDMSGNVWEWCEDWYRPTYTVPPSDSGTTKVERGGSWRSDAAYCRTARRNRDAPGFTLYDLGFRLAQSVVTAPPQTAP